jgi:post-segregation antitoxin (ccd killing protein)
MIGAQNVCGVGVTYFRLIETASSSVTSLGVRLTPHPAPGSPLLRQHRQVLKEPILSVRRSRHPVSRKRIGTIKAAPMRIPQYACRMADTTRITVTLPNDQVAELRKLTDNVSGYVAEAVARQLRHQLLGADLRHHQEEHGEFTEEELAQARARIFGAPNPGGSASAT